MSLKFFYPLEVFIKLCACILFFLIWSIYNNKCIYNAPNPSVTIHVCMYEEIVSKLVFYTQWTSVVISDEGHVSIKALFMKHDNNTQPNLIVHYISHSIPIYVLACDCFFCMLKYLCACRLHLINLYCIWAAKSLLRFLFFFLAKHIIVGLLFRNIHCFFRFDWLIDDHLYSAILRSLEQTHCTRMWCYMSDKLFIARFLNIHRSGVLTALAWLVPHETAAISAQVLCTPYNHAPCHFMQSHIRKVYACLAVTCHLHFWQNDRDLLRATAVTRGWNGYRN